MKILEYCFSSLQWGGLWKPVDWSPGWKTKLYDVYTVVSFFFLASFVVGQMYEVLNSLDDLQKIADNAFLMLAMLGDCGKAANVLLKRGEIIQLTNSLQQDPCRPKTEEETVLQRKFDHMARFNLLRFSTTSWLTAIFITLRSFAEDIPQRLLPFNVWVPFDSEASMLGYWIAYVHQILAINISCAVGVSYDCFVAGLMIQTSAQLNILKHRFIGMPQMLIDMTNNFHSEAISNLFTLNAESKLLSQRVEHHITIFKFAETFHDIFGIVIFLQYSVNTLIICACLLDLAHVDFFDPLFPILLVYIAEMSVQILMYCYYAGEVTIESISVGDAVYEMDWTVLSVSSRRSLVMIMARTMRPITFTNGGILTMNLESFKSLLKLSYSTYNVLQSTQE